MIFDAPDNTGQQVADHLPEGRAWGLKNEQDSNTRKLINSVAVSHNAVQQQIELLAKEFDISQAIDLLEDWEESTGALEKCIFESKTFAERRQIVIKTFKKKPIVTLQDFADFVNSLLPDANISLFPGYEYYTFELGFEIPFLGDVNDKFILVVEVPLSENTFEYEFELDFEGGPDVTALECILNKVIPSNVVLIIEFRG